MVDGTMLFYHVQITIQNSTVSTASNMIVSTFPVFTCSNNLEQVIVGLSTLNNVVQTAISNTDDSTMLFNHDNRIVTMLFSRQYCQQLDAILAV